MNGKIPSDRGKPKIVVYAQSAHDAAQAGQFVKLYFTFVVIKTVVSGTHLIVYLSEGEVFHPLIRKFLLARTGVIGASNVTRRNQKHQ